MSHIEVIRDLRLSNSGELEIMDNNETHYVTCVKLYSDSDYDSYSTFDDESPLNTGFYYSDEHPMIEWLAKCTKKTEALKNLNSKLYRYKNKQKRTKQLEHVTNLLNDLKETMNF